MVKEDQELETRGKIMKSWGLKSGGIGSLIRRNLGQNYSILSIRKINKNMTSSDSMRII